MAQTLTKEGIPVVLLLAEEVSGRDWKGAANLPGLDHTLDEVLAQRDKGVLITDALDAVRNVVKLIQHALADHREILQSSVGTKPECLAQVLDFLLGRGPAAHSTLGGDMPIDRV